MSVPQIDKQGAESLFDLITNNPEVGSRHFSSQIGPSQLPYTSQSDLRSRPGQVIPDRAQLVKKNDVLSGAWLNPQ